MGGWGRKSSVWQLYAALHFDLVFGHNFPRGDVILEFVVLNDPTTNS